MESAGQHVGEGMMEFGYIELGLLLWGAFEAGKWWANQYTIRNMKELLDELGVPRDEQAKLKDTARGMMRPVRLIELTKTNNILGVMAGWSTKGMAAELFFFLRVSFSRPCLGLF